ncbi:MAG: polyisoprenyl-teichoic acid--peptidoglycan teichoic acid transferase [Solirubrobacteraceae bacterium]|jgi:LCP family protein required for cell wall assembly|nr:polyisoprenyl-teichoic acid--peptidoglycan teichoic acid transferase [Solirubrobacteraceae bacterium]
MNDERHAPQWWSMWKRFLIASVLIIALSGAATATVALNTVSGIASEVFPALNHIAAPKGLVTPEYSGGPQTFLILGSDRRVGAKDSYDKSNPPHSDTMLLVRFDPEQGQTSVMSIPRDLMVNITTRSGQVYANEKINSAYTIGSKLGGTKGGIVLAAETIEREVFPGLKLNGIVDVSFKGFIKVVDALGCAYVNVDHHYYNLNIGSSETNYTSIDLQPGYQRLCYQDALDYVRYRHTDSDFVRVARQQDFMRALREQISATDVLEQIDTVAKTVGHAISSTFHASAGGLIELAKLIAFSQAKPLRQVRFQTTNVDARQGGVSFVTSTAALERATLQQFLHRREPLGLSHIPTPAPAHGSSHRHRSRGSSAGSARALGLYPTSGQGEVVKAALQLPFPALYPALQTGPSEQQMARPYALRDRQGHLHRAYVVVWRQNTLGGYYDFEGTNWLDPPLFAHARTQVIGGRSFKFVDDGSHIHVLGWRSGAVLYWVTNTLLEDLSNAQMLAIARSAQHLH